MGRRAEDLRPGDIVQAREPIIKDGDYVIDPTTQETRVRWKYRNFVRWGVAFDYETQTSITVIFATTETGQITWYNPVDIRIPDAARSK